MLRSRRLMHRLMHRVISRVALGRFLEIQIEWSNDREPRDRSRAPGEWRGDLRCGGCRAGASWEVAVAPVVVGAARRRDRPGRGALLGAHRVVYGPVYGAVWMLVAGDGRAAGRRGRLRARGATASACRSMTTRSRAPRSTGPCGVGEGYELAVAPGMTGRSRRAARRSPSRRWSRGTHHADPAGRRRARRDRARQHDLRRARRRAAGREEPVSRAPVKRFARPTLSVVQLMAVASFLYAVPVGAALGEADMKSAIPADATPWEIEKALRAEAQFRRARCTAVSTSCRSSASSPGTWASVSRSRRRARSGRAGSRARPTATTARSSSACPSVISSWFFEPLPEPMQIVLPVQVLRTDKPLRRVGTRAERSADARRSPGDGADIGAH